MKPPSEAKALELLQQHASQYKSKSPSMPDNKTPHERERDRERERILPSHHHLGYPLLSAQYDLSYTSGETRPRAGDDFKGSGVFLTTVPPPFPPQASPPQPLSPVSRRPPRPCTLPRGGENGKTRARAASPLLRPLYPVRVRLVWTFDS